MEELVNSILNKDYETAKTKLNEELSSIVERKLAEAKKKIAADLSMNEATVEKDGLVHLSTGEKVLPSVYKQRRWLAEDDCGCEDKDKKIEIALAKAKMLIQPELDTTAPRIDRTKVVRPKGSHARVDNPPIVDLGPKEAEWMHGKELKNES